MSKTRDDRWGNVISPAQPSLGVQSQHYHQQQRKTMDDEWRGFANLGRDPQDAENLSRQQQHTLRLEPNIYQRLLTVAGRVPTVAKDATVGFGNNQYKAVSHDAITAATRRLFIENGIICSQSLVSSSVVNTGSKTKTGVEIVRYEARYEVSFINAEAPSDKHTVTVEAHALDTGDKAPGKAMSYSMKYAIAKTLSLLTGDQEEYRVEDEAAPPEMSEDHASQLALLVDAIDLETGDGVAAFAESWLEMDSEEQKLFAPYVSKFWPGEVTKIKQRMRDALSHYRKDNQE